MATIEEILKNRDNYRANGIEKVTIDGNEFSDYSAFSFVWEKSYAKSPERSAEGSIGNLDSYATFITPHLKIDFSLMSIDSYRKLMGLIYLKNQFTVTCYDVVNNRMTTNEMYFSTEEMPKLWNIAKSVNSENGLEDIVYLLGVHEYTVEMIGIGGVKNPVINVYYKNADGSPINNTPQEAYDGEDYIVGNNLSASPNASWKMDSGVVVKTGDVVKLHTFGDSSITNVIFTFVGVAYK